MWRFIKTICASWLIVGLRNNGLDVSVAEFIEHRRLRRLMRVDLPSPTKDCRPRDPPPPDPPQRGSANRMRRHNTTLALSVLAAGMLIASAILFTGRWELAGVGGQPYRLDRWTGAVSACSALQAKRLAAAELGVGLAFRCEELSELPTVEKILGPPPLASTQKGK